MIRGCEKTMKSRSSLILTKGKKTSRRFVELFAGIGLVRLAFEQIGWSCVFANDIDPQKQQGYKLNFGSKDFVLKDVWKVKARSLPKGVDLITASFPCTDLSLAGNRAGLKGSQSGTFWALIKIVTEMRKLSALPKMIFVENVLGFLTSNKGQDIRQAVSAINKLNYLVDIIVLDACHFVPQSRPRIFLIATNKNIKSISLLAKRDDAPLSTWTMRLAQSSLRPKAVAKFIQENPDLDFGLFDLPDPPVRKTTLNDVLESFEDGAEEWWDSQTLNKLLNQMSPMHRRWIEAMQMAQTYKYGTVYRRVRNGISRAELRVDGTAGCLRTPRGGSSKQIVLRAGRETIAARWMTPREYARLQGVSDTFKLPENKIQAYFGLGDAVCVQAVHWLASHSVNSLITPLPKLGSQNGHKKAMPK